MPELQINIANLRGKKVMIATPMYGGMGNAMYFSSVLQLQSAMISNGMQLHHCFMMNESLIDRARNGLVYDYLTKSDAEYLLFVDADIQFRPEDVLAMMSFEKELICGPYPKKHINWPIIIEAVKNGIENPATLEKLVGEYVFTPLESDTKMEKIIKVSEPSMALRMATVSSSSVLRSSTSAHARAKVSSCWRARYAVERSMPAARHASVTVPDSSIELRKVGFQSRLFLGDAFDALMRLSPRAA